MLLNRLFCYCFGSAEKWCCLCVCNWINGNWKTMLIFIHKCTACVLGAWVWVCLGKSGIKTMEKIDSNHVRLSCCFHFPKFLHLIFKYIYIYLINYRIRTVKTRWFYSIPFHFCGLRQSSFFFLLLFRYLMMKNLSVRVQWLFLSSVWIFFSLLFLLSRYTITDTMLWMVWETE